MARIQVPFGKAFSKGRSNAAGMQSLVNMYAEPIESEGRTNLVCYSTPARVLFSTIGGGTVRGQITANEIHYGVVGNYLYKINNLGVSTQLGYVEGVDPVDLAFNGNQMDIVAELKTYSYDVNSLAIAEINDANFEQASSCASVAGYSLYAVRNAARFRWRLTNAATFSALDFATAEAESDLLVAVRKVGNEIALLGSTSIEFWGVTGDTGADAFARTSTASASIGCVSRDSAIVVDNGLMWVGRDGKAGGVSVYRAEGYQPRKVSPPQIDNYLETVPSLSNIRAISYQQRGHLFYVLTNEDEWSLALDIATGQWAYRKSGTWAMGADPTGGWDATTFALNGLKQVVGSSDGNLYELQADTYAENSVGIIREATSTQLSFDGKRMFMPRLELEIEAGVGLSSGQGSSPIVMESHSDDGGSTWSVPRNAGMGAIGQDKWRAVWNALGSFRQRIIKFRVSDPVKVVFLKAHADVFEGAH